MILSVTNLKTDHFMIWIPHVMCMRKQEGQRKIRRIREKGDGRRTEILLVSEAQSCQYEKTN